MALPKSKKPKKTGMTAAQSKIFDKKHFGDEPAFPVTELTKMELLKILNYYNYVMYRSEAMEFLFDYLEKRDRPLLKKVKTINEKLVSTSVCWLARLIDRGATLPPGTVDKIDAHLSELVAKYYGKETVEKKTDDEPKVDRAAEKERFYIGDVEELLDKRGDKSVYDYLTANSVPKGYAAKIAAYYAPVIAELREAVVGKDRDLKEGYRHLSKRDLRDLLAEYEKIVSDCDRYADNKTAEKKPRKKKMVPAEKKVGNVQYMPRFDEFQLVSKHPSCILDAKEFWVYDARYRDLTRYVAKDGGFEVRGTSIYNYDEAASVKKSTGRKSKDVVDRVLKEGKLALKKVMDSIPAPAREPNGRLNHNMLILKSLN
jgi:hypothetical protein